MKKEQTSFLDLQRCQGVGIEQYSIKDVFEIDFLITESSFYQSTYIRGVQTLQMY